MILNNDFVVDVPVEEVWELLLDLERVIPCMPGAAVLGTDGDDVRGSMQIKVGPISAHFGGVARFVELDEAGRSAVMQAAGEDPKGKTSANARIRVKLRPQGSATAVDIETDLVLTGKLAQFGRGAIADISSKMIGQFTENLHAEMRRRQGDEGAATSTAASPGAALEARDLLNLVGPTALKAVAAPLLVLGVAWLLWRRRG